MVRHSTLLPLLALLSLALPTSASADRIEHRGIAFWIHRVDPTETRVELFLSDEAGEPNTFPKVRDRVREAGRRLVFAMNAGIFEGNFRPTGLHVSEGRTITELNLDDFVKQREDQFTPNFYLKPNGVFFIRPDGDADVVESERFAQLDPPVRLATQSGPLLVEDGRIHPVLEADSTSVRYRNGVGVTREGEVIFACSVRDPQSGQSNLYRFAELFRDRLDCPNALYLDGDISYVYIRGETPTIRETNWFGGILAVTEPIP